MVVPGYDPFLAELRIFAFNFAPRGWAFCNGQFLPINQNQALFSLLGTTYGGNGQTTFALPDLRGRIPVHPGAGFTQGQAGGETAHTITLPELPTHTHFVQGRQAAGATVLPGGNVLANPGRNAYAQVSPGATALVPGTIGNVGGSQPHQNMAPYLALNICIALIGVFPSRN
jgi:microcystin-dependent protein